MRIDILTLFPEMIEAVISTSIIGRARENEILQIKVYNIRDFANNKHNHVDDYPYGGGAGMVMTPQPLYDCFRYVLNQYSTKPKVIYFSPQGKVLNQNLAQSYAKDDHLILLCGHYEGIDQRVIDEFVDQEISIGDYVLTGGELPALVFIDCISRLIPGVLGSPESAEDESFSAGLLEYPQYTRPQEYEGRQVPDVLMSGNHKKIEEWRMRESLRSTWLKRRDLLEKINLSPKEQKILQELIDEMENNV